MSSRLFQSVREEKGLAYDVSSYIVDYADSGAFVVSAGVDPDRIAPAVSAMLEEMAGVRDDAVPADELARSKRYLAGRLELRMRRPATWHLGWRAGSPARRVLTLDQALAELNAVTSEGILSLAGG